MSEFCIDKIACLRLRETRNRVFGLHAIVFSLIGHISNHPFLINFTNSREVCEIREVLARISRNFEFEVVRRDSVVDVGR